MKCLNFLVGENLKKMEQKKGAMFQLHLSIISNFLYLMYLKVLPENCALAPNSSSILNN